MVKITITNSLGHGSVMFFHHGQNPWIPSSPHGVEEYLQFRGVEARRDANKPRRVNCGTMTAEPWCFADLSTIINHE